MTLTNTQAIEWQNALNLFDLMKSNEEVFKSNPSKDFQRMGKEIENNIIWMELSKKTLSKLIAMDKIKVLDYKIGKSNNLYKMQVLSR